MDNVCFVSKKLPHKNVNYYFYLECNRSIYEHKCRNFLLIYSVFHKSLIQHNIVWKWASVSLKIFEIISSWTITSYICLFQDLKLNCPNNILAHNTNQHSFFLKSKVIFALDYIQIVFKCKKRSSENYMCSNKWVSARTYR